MLPDAWGSDFDHDTLMGHGPNFEDEDDEDQRQRDEAEHDFWISTTAEDDTTSESEQSA